MNTRTILLRLALLLVSPLVKLTSAATWRLETLRTRIRNALEICRSRK